MVERDKERVAQAEAKCERGYKRGSEDFNRCVYAERLAQANQETYNTMIGGAVANTAIITGAGVLAGAVLSDARVKRDVVRIGELRPGIGLYQFRYAWSEQVHVGVIAQEVERVVPDAVSAGADGYLRVDYGLLRTH
jgi:hypothetical protein